ncbi:FadD3 family acyl-CoA ligase [Frankia sp. AgPm24]|uniref:FadD3 family acyl-CoA ligase n=1 Tax=Frankia sp. AgPm24 TaxID=631128 RepID=UPI00200ECFE4|nr:FadD3 family acyl-CoA ligase [Frankia sp. AgPm24]MCK9923949.1 FadD3 family acyl-CoA ligase [Frankia sp. AgPm24]
MCVVGPARTIPETLAAAVGSFTEHQAVADQNSPLTFGELHEQVRTFGAALVSTGIHVGDRVAIWAPNSPEWVVAALGVFQVGASLVPVNTRFKGAEAAGILRRAQVRLLVTTSGFLGNDYVTLLRGAGVELTALATTVTTDTSDTSDTRTATVPWPEFLARATDATRDEADRRAAALTPDTVSDIIFTSGTTGQPKGVVHTHRSTLQAAQDWVAMTGLATGDRYLMVNPFFHMFGLKSGVLAALVAGATMLPEPVFDVGQVLRRVVEEKVTVLPGPPTLYQAILDHPERDRYDLSSLRLAVTGAADIPVTLIQRVLEELPFTDVLAGYGLTEGGTATGTSLTDDARTIATTVGRRRPGVELRIVDGDGRVLPGGQPGEIQLRSATVMSHYLDDPAATAEVLSADGWLRTGDLGTIDDAGLLRIVGRAKDMFIVGGFNTYPAEIENILLGHPDIKQAAVIGVPDGRLGEVGMAFVVLCPGAVTTPGELVTWSRERMANYKVPRYVQVIDALPLNATGKVVKQHLREQAATTPIAPNHEEKKT